MARLEEWKPVVGYEDLYEVSNLGRVKSLPKAVKYKDTNILAKRKGKILKPSHDSDGYFIIGLSLDGKRKTYKVHRLVAEAFLTNTNDLPQINHKNGIRDDNRVENLEWCSARDNIRHKFDELKYNPIGRIAKTGERIRNCSTGDIFASLSEAARSVSCTHNAIRYAILHNSLCMGYKWEKVKWKG